MNSTCLLNEDEVIDLTCQYLAKNGWSITQRLLGNAAGIDIVAERDGARLLVEAKGCTTGVVPDRAMHIQQHRTNSSIAAIGKMVFLYDGSSQLAISFPDERVFRAQVEKAKVGLASLGVAVLWVSRDSVETWNADSIELSRSSAAPAINMREVPANIETSPTVIDNIWQRIRALSGATFRQIRGADFSYEAFEGYIKLSRTSHNISRSDFAKALQRLPLKGTAALQDLRGPSYIYAILTDIRVRCDDY